MATFNLTAENNLTFSSYPVNPDLTDPDSWSSQVTGLRGVATVRHSICNKSVTHQLNIRSVAEKPVYATAQSVLNFTSSCYRPRIVQQYVYFTQQAVAYVARPLANQLVINQTVDLNLIKNKSVTSTLSFVSTSTGYLVKPRVCPYAHSNDTVLLTWPYAAPTKQIELRNPDLGDTDQFEFTRINRFTRNQDLIIYSDPIWPKSRRLIYSIKAIDEDTRNDLLNFLNDSLGQEIGLLDFNNEQWRGIILTPSLVTTQVLRQCGFEVTFQFQGVKV